MSSGNQSTDGLIEQVSNEALQSQNHLPPHVEVKSEPSDSLSVFLKQPRVSRALKMALNPRKPVTPIKPKPVTCTYNGCGKVLYQKSHLKQHMLLHTGELPYVCNYPGCLRRFRSRANMQSHERMHVDPSERTRFYCSISGCFRFYTQRASLRAHLLKHQNILPYSCSFPGCDRRFPTPARRREHEPTHLDKDKRPTVVCPEPGCGKLFYSAASIKKHMFIHTGDYPFHCNYPGCTYKTATRTKIEAHWKSHLKFGHYRQKRSTSNKLDTDLSSKSNNPNSTSPCTFGKVADSVGSSDLVIKPEGV